MPPSSLPPSHRSASRAPAAARVLGRRNGETDPYGLTGRVLALRQVLRQGGALFSDALRFGAAIYDVEYGAHAAETCGADESGVNPIVR